jgi:uncharacterized membrane protein
MYELSRPSHERPWTEASEQLESVPSSSEGLTRPLILRMQENRSQLSQEARLCFSVITVMFMVTSIIPAFSGQWLVPSFSLLAMAALTFALERHGRSQPASETLELGDGRVRHRDNAGHQIELPAFWLRLAAEGGSPSELRLFLRCRDGVIEFGRCLSLDERRAVVPLVAAALAQARGS